MIVSKFPDVVREVELGGAKYQVKAFGWCDERDGTDQSTVSISRWSPKKLGWVSAPLNYSWWHPLELAQLIKVMQEVLDGWIISEDAYQADAAQVETQEDEGT